MSENSTTPKVTSVINRLPSELLAQIFIVIEQTHRHARPVSHQYSGFRYIAAGICQYWREIVMGTPELWNYIFISRSFPREYIQLCLFRSRTCPLHLDITISPVDTEAEQTSQQIARFYDTIMCVTLNGGNPNRWQSFIISAASPVVSRGVIEYIRTTSMPKLRFILIRLEPADDNYKFISMEGLLRILKQSPQRPFLNSLQLHNFNIDFGPDDPTQQIVSSLRRLELRCNEVPYSLYSLHAMSIACSMLESLTFDGRLVTIATYRDPPSELKVLLPSLRLFSLKLSSLNEWTMDLLKMIDSPRLEAFHLFAQPFAEIDVNRIPYFMCYGRVDGIPQGSATKDQLGAGPIYPCLRTLYIDTQLFSGEMYCEMLRAYSGVTKAWLDHYGLCLLCHPDRFLPNLAHLRCPNNRDTRINYRVTQVIEERREWGLPLLSLELVSILQNGQQGWKTSEEVEEDFGFAMKDGLQVCRIEDYDVEWQWFFNWEG